MKMPQKFKSYRYNDPHENSLPIPIFNVYLDFCECSISDIEQ